jgi:hypothetical protein
MKDIGKELSLSFGKMDKEELGSLVEESEKMEATVNQQILGYFTDLCAEYFKFSSLLESGSIQTHCSLLFQNTQHGIEFLQIAHKMTSQVIAVLEANKGDFKEHYS